MILKRFSTFLSAGLVLLSSLAIPAYAVNISYKSVPNFTKYVPVDASGNLALDVFGVSGLSDAAISTWQEIMNTFQGKSERLPFLIYVNSSPPLLQFCSFDSTTFKIYPLASGGINHYYYLSDSTNVFEFTYNSLSSSWNYKTSYIGVKNPFLFSPTYGADKSGIFIVNLLGLPLHSSVSEINDINSLRITDDVSEPEPEPDPPPSPPYVPADPVIPPGNSEYVPYDTSIWKKFLDHIRFNIGSSVSVGLLIFAIIAGVLLIKKIIDYFTK